MIKNFFGILKKIENRKIIASYLVLVAVAISMLELILFHSFFNVATIVKLILGYCSFGLMALSVLLLLDEYSNVFKFLWLFLILSFLVSFLINKSYFDYILYTISFLGLLTVLPSIKIHKRILCGVFLVYILYSIIIAIFANKTETDNSILINWQNTNTSSFTCFGAQIVLLAVSFMLNKKWKIACYCGVVLFIVAEFMFFGRSSIIGTAVVILYLIFQKWFNRISPKTSKWVTVGLCLGAIVFVLLYLVLFKLLGDGVYIFGKDLFSGREIIWMDAFNQVNEYHGWFFGIGDRFISESHYGVYTGSGLHNSMLAYYTLYGGVTLVAVIMLLSKSMERITACFKNKFFVFFIFAFILAAYFEVHLLSAVVNKFQIIVLAYFFTQDKEESKTEQTQEELNIEQTNLTEEKHEEQ